MRSMLPVRAQGVNLDRAARQYSDGCDCEAAGDAAPDRALHVFLSECCPCAHGCTAQARHDAALTRKERVATIASCRIRRFRPAHSAAVIGVPIGRMLRCFATLLLPSWLFAEGGAGDVLHP